MKRIISKYNVFGMAEDISWLYRQMDNKSDILMKHVGKCIIWGKHYHSYSHWIEKEIATFINEIARKKTKSKLKFRHVKSHLFGSMGTEHQDALNRLYDIYDEAELEPEPYPEVNITFDYGIRFFKAYLELADKISYYIINHKIDGRRDYKEEIIPIIYEVLNKYC